LESVDTGVLKTPETKVSWGFEPPSGHQIDRESMRVVELFSGVGLSSWGMTQAGAEVVGACEIDPKFVKAYNSQIFLNPVASCSDVDKYDIPKCDLLSGGPVCKAFSPGANRFGTKGKDDVRNTFPHFLRALDRCSPDNILIENSYGLARFREYLQGIVTDIQARGYKIDCQEIDCYDYGIPQHRRRVVILGSKKGRWMVTKPAVREGMATVAGCLWEAPVTDKHLLTRPTSPSERDYWLRDPKRCKRHPPLHHAKTAGTVVSNYKRGVPYGVVVMPDGQLHMCGPRLAARLQGLDDEYDVSVLSRTKMLEGIGNGFPPPVVKHLVSELMRSV
jgi:site-specific DNA-cytosine methylase